MSTSTEHTAETTIRIIPCPAVAVAVYAWQSCTATCRPPGHLRDRERPQTNSILR